MRRVSRMVVDVDYSPASGDCHRSRAVREAPRFLAEAPHSGSLGGRPNRRGSADPIAHQCRELVGGSARLRSARAGPFPSVGRVPLVHTIAALVSAYSKFL